MPALGPLDSWDSTAYQAIQITTPVEIAASVLKRACDYVLFAKFRKSLCKVQTR